MIRLPTAQRREAAEPIIPLINIVFLLLIFFMLAGEIQRHPDIDPPLAQSADAAAGENGDRLELRADGSLLLAGVILNEDNRTAALKQRLMEADGITLVADRDVPADILLNVLDALRDAGFASVTVLTRAGRGAG